MAASHTALPVVLAVVACVVIVVAGVALCCRGKRGGDPATSANWSSPLLFDKHSPRFESTNEEWARPFGGLAASHVRRISAWLVEVRRVVDDSVASPAGAELSDAASATVVGSPVTTTSTHFYLDADAGMNIGRSASEYATCSPRVSVVEGAASFHAGHLDPLRRW
ncbi:uncharacterized protein Tco025E_01291 [Trypanosoma conorhini]|uniref:Uncharacterized protein n=1 Tax=Trypanosoma conorhini TaxID=83891 RepID=A0A3R7LFX0_9TRYP|nr:uncharacterized protein Tco025E_01291 [Trypanosoma conorhini]RNF26518.1 hypothetical protein Tco025E_01291 [Trypanosoma conorhini]